MYFCKSLEGRFVLKENNGSMFPKIDWLVSSKVKRDVDIDGISVKQLKFDHDARPFFVSLNLR